MKTAGPIVAAALLVVMIAVAVGSGFMATGTVLLVLVLSAIAVPLASKLSSPLDPWMWWVGPIAYLAKLAGSGVRYWVLVDAYSGVGDAIGYHSRGRELAEVWRTLAVPGLDGSMGVGTQFTRWYAGLFYAPYTPTLLGGFFIFATVAFLGQLLLYASFRRSVPGTRLGIYAGLIFFLPALVFWPSSVGKDSLMLLFIGIATYGLARAFDGYRPLWLGLAAFGLAGAASVRPHVAALLAISFAGAALMGRGNWQGSAGLRRVVVLAGAMGMVVVSLIAFGDRFELGGVEDLDPFVADIEERTQQGGSAIQGGAVASPQDLPAALVRVLFRPLPYEAHNLQAMASAVENVALLALVVWRLPRIFRRLHRLRVPFVMMSFLFTGGFVIAFSTFLNLGIITRQRSQVLPFLLVLIVALGWDPRPGDEPANLGQTVGLSEQVRVVR